MAGNVTNLRPFKPGTDWKGNAGGRPQGLSKYIRSKLGEDGELLANYVLRLFADPETPARERWEACCWLADRGWGRPAQAITGAEGEPLAGGELLRLQVLIVEALSAFPDARLAVAEALVGGDGDPPDGEEAP